ncbi:MAG: hypothetical protein ACU0GG_07595 [Paracoccaceae bacterium]
MRAITLVLLLFPGVSTAGESIAPESIELSKDMQATLARGGVFAAATLKVDFRRFSNDNGESILIAEIADKMKSLNANARANKVYGYLAADLDWDGQVTRAELEQYLVGQDPRFVDGYLADGDLNGDGVIDLSEMLEDARRELPLQQEPDRSSVREMLSWDLDRDGRLTWEEVLRVLEVKE